MRVLIVEWEDGSDVRYGMADDFVLPVPLGTFGWMRIPMPSEHGGELAFSLAKVRSLNVWDEPAAARDG